jgi:hypothetical protein
MHRRSISSKTSCGTVIAATIPASGQAKHHPAMRGSTGTWLALISGFLMVFALGVPAGAHAATAAATAPDLHSSDCANGPTPKNFELESRQSGDVGEIDSSTQNLYIGGGVAHNFCQALISSGIVEIFTSSTDQCLAYSQDQIKAYQHVPTGCTSTPTPSYMQWKFIFLSRDINNTPVYELQSQFISSNNGNGKQCVVAEPGSRTVGFSTCDGRGAEQFYVVPV